MRSNVAVSICILFVLAAAAPAALAACDTTPPDLTGFSFSPTSINTTSSAQNVLCTMVVTDDLAGVSAATCSFRSPSFLHTQSCTATTPSAGTPTGGTFSCSVPFPRYAESGTWTATVDLTDAVGNTQTIDPQFQGLPFALTVTSNPDLIPPALTGFSFTPTAVTVSAAPQTVTCNMTVTDALSGVNTATCLFQAPNSNQAQGCVATAPTAPGTRNSGTFSCVLTIPRYADAGTWVPAVYLQDLVGNFAMPAASGTLAVTASPEDVAAPSLTSFSFTPTAVSTGAASKTVSCSMGVADATAGVDTATCSFTYTDPFDPFLTQTQSCTATVPASGTRNSGTFQCNVVLPRYSVAGLWDANVQLADLVGNSVDLPQVEQLTVDCNAGDPETTTRFSNKTTLTWTAVTGATRYNLYRGNISGLVDANADHRPDGGYGTCQNSRDPNLTDLTFTDTDVPTTTQKGFHYLVSYTSGGVEKGLGYDSLSNARTVTACPP